MAAAGLNRNSSQARSDFMAVAGNEELEFKSFDDDHNFTQLQKHSQSDLSIEFNEPKALTEQFDKQGVGKDLGAIDLESQVLIPQDVGKEVHNFKRHHDLSHAIDIQGGINRRAEDHKAEE